MIDGAPDWPARGARALLLLLAVLVFAHTCGPVTTNDLFWHVATGEHLWEVRGFPARDPFSYTTAGLDWYLHEWLTQVLFFGLHQLGGMHLLRLFTGLSAVAICWLVWRFAASRLGARGLVTVVVVAFAILGTTRFQTRPTLFSMALTTAFVHAFANHRGPWLWRHGAVLTLAMLVWVNLHSVGLVGLALYCAFVAGLLGRAWLRRPDAPDRADLLRHALTLPAAVAASCASPSGLQLYGFALQDKSVVMDFITDEWGAFRLDYAANASLTPQAYGVILAVLAVLLATALLTAAAVQSAPRWRDSPALPDPVALALLVACAGGGLMARRFHWFLALALALALPQMLAAARHQGLRAPLAAARIPPALAAALLALLYARELRYEDRPLHENLLEGSYYTRAIAPALDLPGVRFLREAGLQGNAFCHYGSGGMLTYFLHPAVKVFIDSRVDLYRREVFLEFLTVRDGHPDQQAVLDRHGTDIYYRHWEIAPLREPALWTKVWDGQDGDIWLRRHPRNLANLERCKQWHRQQDAAPR